MMLEEEKLVSGKRAVVGRADETAENMKVYLPLLLISPHFLFQINN